MPSKLLKALPLTAEAFQPFGDVIEEDSHTPRSINRGAALRFHNLAKLQPGKSGRLSINIFRALTAITFPYRVSLLECHPLGSQAFIPSDGSRFLVVVAEPGVTPNAAATAAFVTNGKQGVNYRRGVWHAPLASFAPAFYLVIDRIGPGDNLMEYDLTAEDIQVVPLHPLQLR